MSKGRKGQTILKEEEKDYMDDLGEEESPDKMDEEEVQHDEEDEEEDEEEDNDYVNDGFVVTDSEADGEEEEEEDDEQRRKRKKEIKERKKLQKMQQAQPAHKRILKKVKKAEGEDDAMAELEDYHEGSEEEDMQTKKGKKPLKKSAPSGNRDRNSEDYESGQDEDFGDDGEGEEGEGFSQKMGRHATAFQELFMDEDDDQENEEDMDDDKNDEVEEEINYEEIFEPDDIKNRYEREDDRKIKEEDAPERLQLRMIGRKLPDPQEFLDETKWIYEKLRLRDKKYNDVAYQKKIFQFLEALHINMEEVMYIFTYRKSDFDPFFDLEDMWVLYDLDYDWGMFNKQRMRVRQQIDQIKKEVDNIPILLEQQIIDSEQVRKVEEFFNKTTELQSLKFVKDYFDYLLIKIYPVDQHRTLKIRKERKSRLINTYIKCNVHQQVNSVSLPPYELVGNLEDGSATFVPQIQMNKPQQFAENLIRINPNVSCLSKPLDALQCMVDYQSNELFYYPPLKRWVLEQYKRWCYISTEPTELGKKQIDIFSNLYPAKRIFQRPLSALLNEDTWLLVEEAERLNFITVKFQVCSDPSKNQYSQLDCLLEFINKYNSPYLKNIDPAHKNTNMEWNVFRKYNIEHLLQKYLLPHIQNLVRQELHEKSEKWVVRQCQQKFFSMINVEPQKNGANLHRIMSVVQDTNSKIGVVFVDENGIAKDSMILNYFTKKEDHLVTKAREEKRLEEQTLDLKISQFNPSVAVVAANSIESQRLKNILHGKCFSQYGDDTIPQIVAKQPPQYSVQPPYKEHVLKVALSQGRMILNPTSEILSLWNERTELNGCLHIPLHPSKEFVSIDKLQSALEKSCNQIINQMGVELDMFQEQPHLKHLLQHVCGLGPRKAMKINELLTKNPVFFESKIPKKRDYIVTQLEVKTTVFKNMCGFVKFRFSKDPFEKTRIIKDLCKIAKKICKESIDGYQGKFKTEEEMIQYAMDNPNLIDLIDLEDYATQLSEKKGQTNMRPVLNFIKDELINPFYYKRNQFDSISDQDLFFKMIKESPQTFRKGMIVSAKIMEVRQKENQHKMCQLIVKILDNDLRSSILVREEESKAFKVGDIIKAYVDTIFVIEPRRPKDSMTRFDVNCVTLTLQEKPFLDLIPITHPCFTEEKIARTFKFVESEDKPMGIEVQSKKAKKFEPRKIAHPNFKNISMSYAVKLLKNARNGEFIIRPSSKGKQYLAITWKFFDDIFVHLSLKEEIQQSDKFQTKLVLNDREEFDNFDEVIERYIIPCNSHMNVIKDHRKFSRKPLEEIEKDLLKEKEAAADSIPYQFCCLAKYPQYVVLLYCSRPDVVSKEWIKVKYRGLYFHEQYFAQFKELIMWFKNNFSTPEYKRQVKRSEEPFAPRTPGYPQSGGNSSVHSRYGYVKLEGGAKSEKIEGGNRGGQKCQNCLRYGHTANNCKNKRSYPPSSAVSSGPRQCYLCKSSDHIAKDCPSKINSQRNNGGNSSRRDRVFNSRSRSRSYEKK